MNAFLNQTNIQPTQQVSNIQTKIQLHIHAGRLTWNIIMEVWKMIFLYERVIWICRFHVNLPGCKQTGFLRVIQPLSHMIQVGSPLITLDRNLHRKKFAKELSLGHPSRVATDEPLTGLSSAQKFWCQLCDPRIHVYKNVNRNVKYLCI